MSKIEMIEYYKPQKPGIVICDNTAFFAFDVGPEYKNYKEFGLILYINGKAIRYPFNINYHTGSVFGIKISGIDYSTTTYNYYIDEQIIHDIYSKGFKYIPFGKVRSAEDYQSTFNYESFDWENDNNPCILPQNTILYGLNVRSFTMHKSSGVKNKGTFEGIVEKFNYLKSLGITSLVLMPSYEFNECEQMAIKSSTINTMDQAKKLAFDNSETEPKLNCWGFTEGYYFSPKVSYSASSDCIKSFKNFVKEAHKIGLEIIMQFYFPTTVKSSLIDEILKYWVYEYHVDGFRINGFNIPHDLIVSDGILKDTKIWFSYIPSECKNIFEKNKNKLIAEDNGNFRYDIRRFIKGDDGILNSYVFYQNNNPDKYSVINYICDYDGFSLLDLYSYDFKHNESNGENNKDGNDLNYSWNCGHEGDTKKKNVISLRKRLIKNAITILFTSQGIPYIFAGDEFGNSRYGNNNAYCQDNEIGFVEWKNNLFSKELLNYTKQIIDFRLNNNILHAEYSLTNNDPEGSGYPELSYHGIEAWRADLSYNSRMIGLFLNYISKNNNNRKSQLYIGINMHWEKHRLAVPKLKNGYTYKKLIETNESDGNSKENEIPVAERSIVIYEAVKNKEEIKNVKRN